MVRHLSVDGAGSFVAKVSVFGTMNVCEVPLEVRLKHGELVGRIRVRAEQGWEVEVRDLRSLWFSMDFGASVTQFG